MKNMSSEEYVIWMSLLKSKKHVTYEWKFCTDEDDENCKNRKRVKDHCHYTRKFKGAAHSICNLRYKVPDNIPIIIHKASYDTHCIINQLAKEFKGDLDCIGTKMEEIYHFFCTN